MAWNQQLLRRTRTTLPATAGNQAGGPAVLNASRDRAGERADRDVNTFPATQVTPVKYSVVN